MLAIREPLDGEERLIVNVGIVISRISKESPTRGVINPVADVRAGGKRDVRGDNVDSNVPGLNRYTCGSI